ncbi:MAG: SAM-dependent methyltransferase [Deltaproteobacteria bacterium RBG_13_65_10]|jgi:caffeoyl-CoA O-methyltransferase|nr:MAG: SAM-dependent methyltransferase [Deltaproteobacteria bacterium RBG_13_65_10]
MTPALYAYLVAHGHNHDPVLDALSEETIRLGGISRMQVAPEQGSLLSILVRAIGARSAIEIGTFTGYSAICIARGLAPDGRLLCCDTSEAWTSIARRYFEKAGVADQITLRIGPAIETLNALGPDERPDFAFIDADKRSYRAYYEALLPRVRSNGLLVLDNVLWSGRVIDPADREEDTQAIRAMNDFIATDRRVQAVMLAVADGLTIVRKRVPGEVSERV